MQLKRYYIGIAAALASATILVIALLNLSDDGADGGKSQNKDKVTPSHAISEPVILLNTSAGDLRRAERMPGENAQSDTQKIANRTESVAGSAALNEIARPPERMVKVDLFSMLFIIVLGLGLIASVAFNYMMYKWRKSNGDGHVSLVPAELLTEFSRQKKASDKNQAALNEHGRIVNDLVGDVKDDISKLLTALTLFREKADVHDIELERWKAGYDASVYKKFLSRFIRLDLAFSEDISAAKNGVSTVEVVSLEQLQDLLRDALEECGVEQFAPAPGERYETAFGIDENFKKIETDQQELAFQIAEVRQPGYQLQAGNGTICLRKAKVSVYVLVN